MLRPGLGEPDDLIHTETLPRLPDSRMDFQPLACLNAQHRMGDSRIPQMEGRRFPKPLANVRLEWRQKPHKKF